MPTNEQEVRDTQAIRTQRARAGGRALAAQKDTAYFQQIGRSGGLKVSSDRKHMSRIGQKGGEASRGVRRTRRA